MLIDICAPYDGIFCLPKIVEGGRKMNKFLVLLSCFIVSMVSLNVMAAGDATRLYRYGHLFVSPTIKMLGNNTAPPSYVINIGVGNGEGGVRSFDILAAARVCPQSSSMICIESSLFSFAVPCDFPNGPDKWKSGKVTYYRFGGPRKMEILGQSLKLWIIKAVEPDIPHHELQYLYSPKRGLVAYAILPTKGGKESEFLVLLDKCGYAAHDCKLSDSQLVYAH